MSDTPVILVCTCTSCGIVVRIQEGQAYVACACQAPYTVEPEVVE